MKDSRRRAISERERVKQTMADLAGRMVLVQQRLADWQFREGYHRAPGKYAYDGPWRKYRPTDSWGGEDRTAWFRKTVRIPPAMQGKEVVLRAYPGGEGILRVDGAAVFGMDFNHREYCLVKRARAERRYRIELECYFRDAPDDAIRNDVRTVHSFTLSELVVYDPVLRMLHYDLRAVLDAALAVEETDPEEHARLMSAARRAAAMLDPYETRPNVYRRSARKVRDFLAGRVFDAKPGSRRGNLHLVGHCHLDLYYVWPYRESVRKNLRTNLIAGYLADRFPDFAFSQSQAKLYADNARHYPAEFRRLRRAIRKRRFEPVGGMWVEPDGNLPCGEALVRQILYGRKYFRREFGVRSTVCWMPDVFGLSASMPQILLQGGFRLFYTNKQAIWHDTNEFPHSTFLWEGIDGSRIPAQIPPTHFVGKVDAASLRLQWQEYIEKDPAPHVLYTYGFGDGGGGPTEDMLQLAERFGRMRSMPNMRLSTVEEWADALCRHRDELPVWADELYLEMHRGAQTTKGNLKLLNRRAEVLLRNAELLSSVAALRRPEDARPPREVEDAWRNLLECHFHDAVTGTHCTEAGREVAAKYESIIATAERTVLASGRTMGLSRRRKDLTVVNLADGGTGGHLCWKQENATALADSQHALPSQRTRDGRILTWIDDLPPVGHRVLKLGRAKRVSSYPFKATARGILSPFYELNFDARGRIARLIDRRANRPVLTGPGNEFRLYEDKPGRFEAWDIAKDYRGRPIDAVEYLGAESGPLGEVFASRVLCWRVLDSLIEQEIVLYAHSPRIDFSTRIDWREDRKLLRVEFPLAVHAAQATYEIAYGVCRRSTRPVSPFEKAKFEVPFHRWFDVAEHGYGVALLNNAKYGGCVRQNLASISLLKAPRFPDPTSDLGEHRFTYSLLPHVGGWQEGGVLQEAHRLNNPLFAWSGALPTPRASYLDVDVPGVCVEAFKRAEDGRGWILRLVDYYGQSANVRVGLPVPLRSATPCSILEEPVKQAAQTEIDGCSFRFRCRPFGIHSFRVAFGQQTVP